MASACRCAVMSAFNAPISVREYPVPDALGPGEMLLKVELAGMCGTDVHLHHGQLNVPCPLILGHETTGLIAGMGSSDTKDWLGRPLSVGDRVSFTVGRPCGTCRYCRVYRLPSRCVNRRAYGVNVSCEKPPHLMGGYGQY